LIKILLYGRWRAVALLLLLALSLLLVIGSSWLRVPRLLSHLCWSFRQLLRRLLVLHLLLLLLGACWSANVDDYVCATSLEDNAVPSSVFLSGLALSERNPGCADLTG
jgi:hypothetical protein